MSNASTVPPGAEAPACARPDLALSATINLSLAALGLIAAVCGGTQIRIEPTASAVTTGEAITEEKASAAAHECLIDRTLFITWATRLLASRAKDQG